ncbi:acetylornithine aminotransferase apoenzyme [Thermodesulfobium acidiphilum]|uniref:Acetylornithine aminotransferase apoenzyme n=1 Tax=Thermodesulfobium acidiphilum TaxID=1794699 RepID=A0A2R4W014_THEAF|nr:acetylornithine/succinylornithine family transaminase [Thermodesulfobium acidiphilum]AWB10137.1 acetylornithine aminotransferase apoenzyme [Thermodesulfobium acidiphilum]
MKSEEWIELEHKVHLQTYKRYPVVLASGEGVYLKDIEDKKYLDFIGGISVCSLGHSHPEIAEILHKQAHTLIHASNLFYHPNQILLAKKLVDLSGLGKVFFCNSGAEANEGALKIARAYHFSKGIPEKNKFLAFEGSFHGRTFGALSVTGQEKYQEPFRPLVPGVVFGPMDNLDKFLDILENEENLAAVIMETMPVEGMGIFVLPKKFVKRVREICDQKDILLILDEVQAGIARTGKMFCYEHYEITPDIVSLAKGLGTGVPIGAVLARDSVASHLKYGQHATTFGGSPLICSVSLKVLEIIERDKIVEHVAKLGKLADEVFDKWLKEGLLKDYRGMGLLWGIDPVKKTEEVFNRAFELGLFVNMLGTDTLRIAPPLIISNEEFEKGLNILEIALK